MSFDFPVISADSHITEPPNCYIDHIDPAYRDIAPRIIHDDEKGDLYLVEGMKRTIQMGLVAAAGKPADELSQTGAKFEELHRSGWDSTVRLADQDRDGVSAEIIYPTVGMVLCNHEDVDYKKACFDAYNRWIAGYCDVAPDRLLGCGQTALRTVEEGIADLESIRSLGLRGVMMPGDPGLGTDYDDEVWDPFWEAAIDMGIPPQLPHSHHSRWTRQGPPTEHLPHDRAWSPGHHGHARVRWCVRTPSGSACRLRRSRRWLGSALHVPNGPCIQTTPQLAAAWGESVEASL